MTRPLSGGRSAAPGDMTPPPGSGAVDAVEVIVDLLSGVEDAAAPEAFYDRLCEAVCRVTSMERAVIFCYDSARRRVLAAGSHRIEQELFADMHVSVESTPLAQRALSEDRVVEVAGNFEHELPAEYAGMLRDSQLACTPMVAGGLWVGVILSDRPPHLPPLEDPERHALWTLGKTAALATVARIATSQGEKSKQLEQRIDLARDIHEQVVQRLFGVSLALSGEGQLDAESQQRCAEEIQGALADLRAAVQRPLARAPRSTQTTLAEELERLASQSDLGVVLEEGDPQTVPADLEPLAQSVLAEAIRNAYKHATPTRVGVRILHADGAFVLEVTNDGIRGHSRHSGMGLRLAALEALGAAGVVEFGKRGPDLWQVRLAVPDERR